MSPGHYNDDEHSTWHWIFSCGYVSLRGGGYHSGHHLMIIHTLADRRSRRRNCWPSAAKPGGKHSVLAFSNIWWWLYDVWLEVQSSSHFFCKPKDRAQDTSIKNREINKNWTLKITVNSQKSTSSSEVSIVVWLQWDEHRHCTNYYLF